MAAKTPGSVSFFTDEIERIEFAELVLMGVPPSEVPNLTDQQKWDLFAIYEAKEALKRGKMPGQR